MHITLSPVAVYSFAYNSKESAKRIATHENNKLDNSEVKNTEQTAKTCPRRGNLPCGKFRKSERGNALLAPGTRALDASRQGMRKKAGEKNVKKARSRKEQA